MSKKLSDFKLNKSNPRLIKEAKFDALKKNVQEFEKMLALRPIIVDKKKVIIGGNNKYRALIALGYTEVPDEWIRVAADLTEEERRRFIMLDNAHAGENNWEILANEWDTTELKEWGIDIPNFSPPADNTVTFGVSPAKGLRLKVTFQSGEQLEKVLAVLQGLGITEYKVK